MSSENSGNSAAQGVGDGIKGVFNAVHGAGEVIRGTVNDTLDKGGEAIASDGKTTGTDGKRQDDLALSGHAPQDHSATVDDGKQQLNQGIHAVSHAGQGGNTNNA